MDFSYIIILAGVLILSPFILALASSQNKKTKNNLRLMFLGLLVVQTLAGFLNWESFKETGRSGFELALSYPRSVLGVFFLISILQILLILFTKKFNLAAVFMVLIGNVIALVYINRDKNIYKKYPFSI